MNGLERRRIAAQFPGTIHLSIDDGPDDRDDYDWDAGEGPCCMASAMRGPRACSCWQPIYDLDQITELALDAAVETRSSCCDDCAYRNGSPERADGYDDELSELAGSRSVFACHQGMRRVIFWRHPDGRELPAGDGAYDPPVVGAVAFKADGQPAERCAGWASHRRALLGGRS